MASAETTLEPVQSSPFAAPVVTQEADLSLTTRQALANQLRDPHRRFAPGDTLTLLTLMREAASSRPPAIPWPWVVWCEPGQTVQPHDAQGGGHCVLVAPVSTNSGWELHSALIADPGTGPLSLPAHVPQFNQYRCRSYDIFDVIMQTLHHAARHRQGGSDRQLAALESPPGLPLRRALAQWLETRPLLRRPLPGQQPAAMSPRTLAARDGADGSGASASASPRWVSPSPPSSTSSTSSASSTSPPSPPSPSPSIPTDARSGPPTPSQQPAQGQRAQTTRVPPPLQFNGMTIHLVKNEVLVGTRPLNLSLTHYRILLYLAQNAGRVVTGEALKDMLIRFRPKLGPRSVHQHVSRMRARLHEADPNHRWIETIWGAGYMFVDRET